MICSSFFLPIPLNTGKSKMDFIRVKIAKQSLKACITESRDPRRQRPWLNPKTWSCIVNLVPYLIRFNQQKMPDTVENPFLNPNDS